MTPQTPTAATAQTAYAPLDPAGPAGALDTAEGPAQDAEPAGQITLRGRNRACNRARALAGLALGVGLAAVLTELDTTVSVPGITA